MSTLTSKCNNNGSPIFFFGGEYPLIPPKTDPMHMYALYNIIAEENNNKKPTLSSKSALARGVCSRSNQSFFQNLLYEILRLGR
jgi:hypothetical protein